MTEILLGPTLTGGATTKVKDKTTGKVYYKKQILPEGKFKYRTDKGEDIELDLTAGQHKTFVQSFKDKAYPEVPFQIGHDTSDPLKKRKGTMANVEYVPGKGSWGYFSLEEDAAKHVEKYPNFGVSPRLVLNLDRMDGKKFAGAIQHVAGTDVPRGSDLSPWEKIELSEDETPADATVLDFSSETITAHKDVKETNVTKATGTGEKVITLSEDEYNFFTKMKKEYEAAEVLLGGETEKKEETSPTVDLSEVTGKADKALAEIAAMRANAVKDPWKAQKALLLSQGVPPAALDLADPVMTAPEAQVFDLSTDEGTVKVDSKTQMLGQLELMKGMIDLSGERGHGIGGTDPDVPSAEQMDAWMRANGI